jgi:K+ transporter
MNQQSHEPVHAIRFLADHGWGSLAVLGGVFLAITGGEALYADMGHIGRNPIRSSWYGVVLPALLLSYAGQAAMLAEHPEMTENPFFKIVPEWALYPMVALATVAVIRSGSAPLLSPWRRALFGFLFRNAIHMVDRFHLPAQHFVEIGRQFEL